MKNKQTDTMEKNIKKLIDKNKKLLGSGYEDVLITTKLTLLMLSFIGDKTIKEVIQDLKKDKELKEQSKEVLEIAMYEIKNKQL